MTDDPSHPQDLTPPAPTPRDWAHSAVRGALSLAPVVGGAASELFVALVTPPLERRRQEWMTAVGAALTDLAECGRVDLNALRDDPGFIDTVLQATNAALRTSQEAKRDALCNTILNSTRFGAPDLTTRHIFIGLIDEFTDWHLHFLKLCDDPVAWFASKGVTKPALSVGALVGILEAAFPNTRPHGDLVSQIWKDLHDHGLVNTDSLHTIMSSHGLWARRTTDLGRQFLAFLADPR
ncbi:MAG TPA: hypothetical protein VLH75_08650 [Longimicrobiales bacterium]|nr:hypothetical protein [Longimicrobiales bacterium]